MISDRSVVISIFPPRKDGKPTHETGKATRAETTLSELISSLTETPDEYQEKHLAPAWSPISYSGDSRKAAEAVSVCALAYDFDHRDQADPTSGPPTPEQYGALAEWLAREGHTYVIHETWTPGRARLVLPLAADCPASAFPALWQAIAAQLPIVPDPTGCDLARLLYAPSRPPGQERNSEQGGQHNLDAARYVKVPDKNERKTQPPGSEGKSKPDEIPVHKIFDLSKLQEEIAEHHNPERRAELEALVDGTLRIPPGTRETLLHPLLGSLSHLRHNPPGEVVEEMLRRVLSVRDGAEEMLEEWVRKAMHSWERGADRKEVLDQQVAEVEKFFRDETWRKELKMLTDSKGGVVGMKPLECNLLDVLKHDEAFAGFLKWNVLKNEIEVHGGALEDEPTESLGVPLASWFQKSTYNCPVSSEKAGQALQHHALHNKYDPVSEFLSKLPKWDGTKRLSRLLLDYAQAQGAEDWVQIVTRKFFIAAVARAKRPGCQVDNTLVLQGEQGGGKTSFVRVMGAGFHVETSLDLHNKDAVMTSAGNWLVELGELASLRKSDVESVRNFLTRKEDQIRLPYGRVVKSMPRRCVFIGTTNARQPLSDPEGNRRFWVVSVGTINTAGLEKIRDQVWAEALHAFNEGEQWWLTPEQAVRAKSEASVYEAEDMTETEILAWLENQKVWPKTISAHDVAQKVFQRMPGTIPPHEIANINRVFYKLRWKVGRKRMGGKQVRCFEVPPRDELLMGLDTEDGKVTVGGESEAA